jgi:HPt (histidine-containing phosphotransfer) domain-containing protein
MNSKKDKAFEVGMNDYLSKPFQPAQLLEKLNHFLHHDFKQDSYFNKIAHTFQFNELLDHHTLRELYANDWGYAFEMFGMFLRYSLKELEAMPDLLETNDWEALHRLAHKVKPTLGMVGAPDLEKQFELLEITAKSAPEKEHIQSIWNDIRTKMDVLAPVVEADWSKLKKMLND